FFSSRRLHTRSKRDWSSDVCSSDLYLTISYGVFPWISIALALSFGLYGLFKKAVKLDSAYSLTVETLLLTPIALIYLFTFVGVDLGFAASTSWTDTGLLLISGIATAVPLL